MRLAAIIDDTLLMDDTLDNTAQKLGLSSRHLRKLFAQTFGVEPKEYLTTRRLLFAKQLLQDTALPIAQVAYSAGFTPGRLTINMAKAYGFTPAQFRKQSPIPPATVMVLRADYRPPFNWEALLGFLAGRATPYEWIENNTYYRVVDGYEILVKNVADKHHLTVEIPIELSRQAHTIVAKIRALFDLDANPLIIEASLGQDPVLGALIVQNPGLRVPGCWDRFEMLLRVIVGQQVSVAGATTIMRRVVDGIGITPETIAASSPEKIAKMGIPLKRATTIWQAGTLVRSGVLNMDEPDPDRFYAQLVAIPGIGPWTAEYLRMRALHWPDAFPAGDLGLQKAVVKGERITAKQLEIQARAWQPWRSYATILLWKSLENKGG
jgi:AraC family transcriptional regulator of adaptative response / DNA-3-methyladenine glycosylase II